MPRSAARRARSTLPTFIKPQLSRLVGEAPEEPDWLHEIKFDGYRIHARLDRGDVRLLTSTGLDWTHKYPQIAKALTSVAVRQAYVDGELCGVMPDGRTSFNMIQAASDSGNADALVFFLSHRRRESLRSASDGTKGAFGGPVERHQAAACLHRSPSRPRAGVLCRGVQARP